MKKILIISGSGRPGNNTQRAAKFVAEQAKQQGETDVKLIRVEDLKMAHGIDADDKFTKAIAWADAFVIVSPEWNHSISGKLKMALDSGSVDSYLHKPVVLAGVSSGGFGGTRVVMSMTPIAIELGLIVSSYNLYFSHTGKLFDEDGALQDESSSITDNVNKSLTDLLWLANKLN